MTNLAVSLRVMLLSFVVATLAGRTAARIAAGRSGADISSIVPGATRAQVEAIVGEPVREWITSAGVHYRLYRYDAGVAPDKTGAVFFGFFEAISLGIGPHFLKVTKFWGLRSKLGLACLTSRPTE